MARVCERHRTPLVWIDGRELCLLEWLFDRTWLEKVSEVADNPVRVTVNGISLPVLHAFSLPEGSDLEDEVVLPALHALAATGSDQVNRVDVTRDWVGAMVIHTAYVMLERGLNGRDVKVLSFGLLLPMSGEEMVLLGVDIQTLVHMLEAGEREAKGGRKRCN